ncbi:MAG TPA: nucleoside hydrolase [Candidatus Mediterraneibacter norfolkensis]|nr:nucleoside hydrolase [Candidatus Mediterraneibacter norfolkensis]
MWKYDFKVPENRKIRMIVHTDCKNEADDQYALAHHLMTPRFDVRGIVAGHFYKTPRGYREAETARASYDEILKIVDLMGLKDRYPVLLGAEREIPTPESHIDTEGARFIIEEALSDEERPLYIVCQGALTDVASALLMKPEIAGRMKVIWVGGGTYPQGGREANLMMDINAANIVFASEVELWQIPRNVYKMFGVSLAELQLKVRPCGKIGEYLFRQLVEFNMKAAATGGPWPYGEIWGLGDQASIAVLMEDAGKVNYDLIEAPKVRTDMTYEFGTGYRKIRVYRTAEVRLTMEDFFAKLAINFGE